MSPLLIGMERVAWPDIAKGLAIILVVVAHTGSGLESAKRAEVPEWWELFYSLSYTFMVPVFFLLSGWFSELSRKLPKERLQRTLTHLVVPYCLWSFLQAAVMIVTKAGNKVPTWSQIPSMIIEGYMQFWFLHALIIFSVVDVVFRTANVGRSARAVIALSLACWVVARYPVPYPFWDPAKHWVYFEFGALAASLPRVRLSSTQIWRVGLGCIAGVVGLNLCGIDNNSAFRVFPAFLGIGACLCVSALLAERSVVARPLVMLGQCSLAIYILHMFIVVAARYIPVHHFATLLFLGAVSGILVPFYVARLYYHFEKRVAIPIRFL